MSASTKNCNWCAIPIEVVYSPQLRGPRTVDQDGNVHGCEPPPLSPLNDQQWDELVGEADSTDGTRVPSAKASHRPRRAKPRRPAVQRPRPMRSVEWSLR